MSSPKDCSHMNGTQIVLVYFVGNQLIFYVVVVQKPGDVRFLSAFSYFSYSFWCFGHNVSILAKYIFTYTLFRILLFPPEFL